MVNELSLFFALFLRYFSFLTSRAYSKMSFECFSGFFSSIAYFRSANEASVNLGLRTPISVSTILFIFVVPKVSKIFHRVRNTVHFQINTNLLKKLRSYAKTENRFSIFRKSD